MLILAICPQCQAEHELSDKLLSQTINCPKCEKPFKVTAAPVKEESKTVTMQSLFSPGGALGGTSQGTPARLKRLRDGRHSLVLAAPPREEWSPPKDMEAEERFEEFDHDSRAMEDFLERERSADDYSWLLVAGLVVVTMVVLSLLGLAIALLWPAGTGLVPGRGGFPR